MMVWLGSFYLNSSHAEALRDIYVGFLQKALILLCANALLKGGFWVAGIVVLVDPNCWVYRNEPLAQFPVTEIPSVSENPACPQMKGL